MRVLPDPDAASPGSGRNRSFKWRLWLCIAAPLTLAAETTQAQSQAVPDQYRTVDLNYVYAASLGFGGYSLAGLSASVYTIPLQYKLHDVFQNGWTLRLLAPVQGGIYSFRANDTDGRRIAIDQQSLSLVPGAELQIPLGDRAVLKPFAQFGLARSFGDGVGNPDSWIYLAGARSVAQWRSGEFTFSLGTGIVFAGDKSIGSGFSENYIALQAGGEIRHPLGFSIGGFTPDLGVYAADYYYPSALRFSRFLRPPLRVANQNEIGFSVGSATPLHILFLSNPRIGAGVVFGGGLTVWHINFGFPF